MFCGSCMHDNTWAKALMNQGADVSLLPTYTPIRVDEEDNSQMPIFLGGINIYLEQKYRFWSSIPRIMTRWLDSPGVINFLSKMSVSNDAAELGGLMISLLEGEAGPHRKEIDELADYIAIHLKPDVICFSNALMVGILKTIKKKYDCPVFCTLQGDDVFLEALNEPYQSTAIRMMQERCQSFDGFITHSQYYQDFMSEYLAIPAEKFSQLPLAIRFDDDAGQPKCEANNPFTIGYFARICPEKGLHQLVSAFEILHARHPQSRLRAGGYLGGNDRKFFNDLLTAAKPLGTAFEYIGSPATKAEKIAFYKSLDLFSVPTVYREPKGIPILDAWAHGLPVVQPEHGAFPEMISRTQGGLLFQPGNIAQLAERLEELYLDHQQRHRLANAGYENVRQHYDLKLMAEQTLELFSSRCA